MMGSVGTFSVGTGEDEGMALSAAVIAVTAIAVLTFQATPGTVDVDESSNIGVEPAWPSIAIELTQDIGVSP